MSEKNNFSKLLLPSLRATFGDWIYYVSVMSAKDVAERVKCAEVVHKHKSLNEMLQRQITKRSSNIAEYLIKQKQRFFNAIIVGVYLGEPEWFPIDLAGNDYISKEELPDIVITSIGILSLSGEEELFALDGQHRVEGIRTALSTHKEIGKDEQTVIFVAHKNTKKGIERTRRLFSTLNRYAKPVTPSEIIVIDEDDAVAIITRELLQKNKIFSKQDVLHVSKTKTVPRNNKK